jgi:hypothetical protein
MSEKPVKFVFRISFTNNSGATESAIVMADGKDSALPGQKPVGDACISAQAAAVAFVNAAHVLNVSEIARDVEVVGTAVPRARVNPPPPNVIRA